jgi:hypothetical protein
MKQHEIEDEIHSDHFIPCESEVVLDSDLESADDGTYEADDDEDELEVSLRIRIMRDEAISSVELLLVDTNGILSIPESEGELSMLPTSDKRWSMEEALHNDQLESDHYTSMLSREVSAKQEWDEAMKESKRESHFEDDDEDLDCRSLRHSFWENRFQKGWLKTKELKSSRKSWSNPSWASIRWEYMESP